MRTRIRRLLDGESSLASRALERAIQLLIVASLVAFCAETYDLDPGTQELLDRFEVVAVAIFTAEYVLRLVSSERPVRFVTSFFGLVDLLAIAPFYAQLGLADRAVDLRAVRALRLFRVLRAFKLMRSNQSIRCFARAFAEVREELALFFSVTLFIMFIAAVGIYQFESDAQPNTFGNIGLCLWWALTTLTTVGYGDAYPITAGGKLFTFAIVMIGLGVVAIPAGLIAASLTKVRADMKAELAAKAAAPPSA